MPEPPAETLTSHLSRVAFLRGLTSAELNTVAQAAHTRQCLRETFIFQQGDTAEAMYVLLAGQVRMTQLTPDGNQVILRYIQPGDMFGGIAAMGLTTYPATAQVTEEGSALFWDARTIHDLILQIPQLGLNALEHAADTIIQLQDRVRELQTERVERRVARALLRLASQTGSRTEAGILIDMPLSRQDLAEITGTNLYSVSRILSAWEKQGLVESRRERVVLLVPHAIVEIAEDLPPTHPPSKSAA